MVKKLCPACKTSIYPGATFLKKLCLARKNTIGHVPGGENESVIEQEY